MSIRQKMLFSVLILNFVVIIASSAGYYYLLHKDLRHLSRKQIQIAFDILLDELSKNIAQVVERSARFSEDSLANEMYVLSVALKQFKTTADTKDWMYWRHVQELMSRVHRITDYVDEFAPLIDAVQIVIYNQDNHVQVVYQHLPGQKKVLGMYLDMIHDGTFLSVHTIDDFSGSWDGVADVPQLPLPKGVPPIFESAVPDEATTQYSLLGNTAAIKITAPIHRRNTVYGMYVIHLGFRQHDLERYSRFSQTAMNIFAGTSLSLGTLPEYTTVTLNPSDPVQHIDFLRMQGEFPVQFSDISINGQKYYQGKIVLGDGNKALGAITAAFSRTVEKQKTRELLLLVTGVALILGICASLATFLFSHKTVRFLQQVINYVEQLSKGAIPDKITRDYKGELGQIKNNLNILIDAMSDITHLAEAIADGNLEIDARERSEHDRLMRALNEMVRRLKTTLGDLQKRTVELTKSKEAAEAANAAKSEFLARMSHEIRTPINAVTGLTNIVLKSELTVEQRDYLSKVQIASNNLLEVINDILDFSKVEAGRLDLAHTPFDLDWVLEKLADLFSNRVAQKDIELVLAIAPQVPRLLTGDAGRLTQVLANLVENAVKFTETGEIVIRVELNEGGLVIGDRVISGSLKNEGGGTQDDPRTGRTAIEFAVSDTGIGIAADVLPILFDPFTQADGYLTRKYVGTGLGLAICRRLVELMGGRIWAESTPGQGSTFSFTVMLNTQREEKPRLILPGDLHGLKTLVVDDSESSRQALIDMLVSFSLNVAAVNTGEKAILALQDESYQLVLLDWKMPGMDGIETARRIRELEHHGPETENHKPQTLIIILVTACGQEIVQQRIGTATMVDAMLPKPIKASQLFNTILELFGQKEAVVERQIHKPATGPLHRLTGRRVLVVEDSELNRDVVVALMEEAGLLVDTAEHGGIAVEKVTESPKGYYDAVLMDIQMPVMDGYDATKKIREFENQQAATFKQPVAKTPIIALTAHALKGEKEKCLAADMDDYLSKPIDEQELLQALLKWVTSQWVVVDAGDEGMQTENQAVRIPEQPPVVPPHEDLLALYDLAMLGSMQGIQNWAAALKVRDETYAPFADRLCQLARGFRTKVILRMVEQYLPGKRS